MWTMIEERLMGKAKADPVVKARLPALEAAVSAGRISPAVAAEEVAQALGL
jgi:LAO/AO transport system kinase